MKKITLDIIVPSFRADPEKLQKIIDLNIDKSLVEKRTIIIIDNPNISNDQIDKIKQRNVLVHKNKQNMGASKSRNVGIELSKADYLLFLDDDIVPNNNLLNNYLKAIRSDPDSPGFVGVTKFPNPCNSFTKALIYSDILTFFDYAEKVENMSWGVTANLLIKKKALDGIRFDQETFPKKGGGEDIDFCLNIIKKFKNKKMKTVSSAKVKHPWWNDGKFHLDRFFRWSFGDSVLPSLHPEFKYLNFPNLIGFLILSSPLIFVYNFKMLPLWLITIFISEFLIEFTRVRLVHKKFANPFIVFFSIFIRTANDLGRFVGYLRNKMFPFIQRFDYFTTGISIRYERKLASIKFLIYFTITVIMTYHYILK